MTPGDGLRLPRCSDHVFCGLQVAIECLGPPVVLIVCGDWTGTDSSTATEHMLLSVFVDVTEWMLLLLLLLLLLLMYYK